MVLALKWLGLPGESATISSAVTGSDENHDGWLTKTELVQLLCTQRLQLAFTLRCSGVAFRRLLRTIAHGSVQILPASSKISSHKGNQAKAQRVTSHRVQVSVVLRAAFMTSACSGVYWVELVSHLPQLVAIFTGINLNRVNEQRCESALASTKVTFAVVDIDLGGPADLRCKQSPEVQPVGRAIGRAVQDSRRESDSGTLQALWVF